MKTLKSTGPLLISVKTDQTPSVSKGMVIVQLVRYETYEMTEQEFCDSNFTIHDSNCQEAKLIAALVKVLPFAFFLLPFSL